MFGIPSRNRTSIRGLGNPRSIQLNYGDMYEHFKQIKTQNQHFAKKQINVAFLLRVDIIIKEKQREIKKWQRLHEMIWQLACGMSLV